MWLPLLATLLPITVKMPGNMREIVEKMARAVCLFGGKWFSLGLCNEALMQYVNCLDLGFHRLVSYTLLQSIGIIYEY